MFALCICLENWEEKYSCFKNYSCSEYVHETERQTDTEIDKKTERQRNRERSTDQQRDRMCILTYKFHDTPEKIKGKLSGVCPLLPLWFYKSISNLPTEAPHLP